MSANRNKNFYRFQKGRVGNWIRHGGYWMTTALAMVWLAGCGGAPESPQPQPPQPSTASAPAPEQPVPEPAAEPTTPAPPAAEPTPPQPAGEVSLDGSSGMSPPAAAQGASSNTAGALVTDGPPAPQEPAAKSAEKPAEKASRPESFADWKLADYVGAKQDRDPRLPGAIHQLGAKHVGDASIVEILAAVLRQTPPGQQPAAEVHPEAPVAAPGGPPGGLIVSGGGGSSSSTAASLNFGGAEPTPGGLGVGPNQEVIAATVVALVVNNTDPARKVLRDVVTGELPTDNDQAAAPLAIKGLLEQPSPENETLILGVLIEPEKVRKAAAVTATDAATPPGPSPMDYAGGAPPQPLSAAELRAQAMPLVDAAATESFRVKLMSYLLSDRATPQQRIDLVPLLNKPRPENLTAQLLVYQAVGKASQLKPVFEKYFAELSSVALGHVLGVLADKQPDAASSTAEPGKNPDGGWGGISPEGNGAGGGAPGLTTDSGGGSSSVSLGPGPMGGPAGYGPSGIPGSFDTDAARAKLDNPAVIYPVAKKLWDAAVARTVADRAQTVASLDAQSPTLALARTMPADPVRAAMYKLLSSHFKDGPGGLLGEGGAGGMTGGAVELGGGFQLGGVAGAPGAVDVPKVFCDPGLLVVIKSLPLPREEKPKRSSASRRASPSALQIGGEEPPAAIGGAETKPAGPPEQWLKASESLLVQLCQQCRAAASAPTEDAKAADKMPIRMHTRAKVVARYDCTWPADAAGKLGEFKLDPIDVHYVRIEEENQYSRLEKHYRRLGKPQQRPFGTGGVRFDALRDSKTPGYKLSTDVLITRTGGGGLGLVGDTGTVGRGRQKEPAEAMVVEILTIEMKDPTGAKPAAAADAAQ